MNCRFTLFLFNCTKAKKNEVRRGGEARGHKRGSHFFSVLYFQIIRLILHHLSLSTELTIPCVLRACQLLIRATSTHATICILLANYQSAKMFLAKESSERAANKQLNEASDENGAFVASHSLYIVRIDVALVRLCNPQNLK